jgi:hypothetical protein
MCVVLDSQSEQDRGAAPRISTSKPHQKWWGFFIF